MQVNKYFLISLICFVGGIFASVNSYAQIADEKFGKNRIQYRLFNWKYYSTPHFEIYYYPGGQYLAKHLTEKLEDEHEAITDLLGYAPYAKTKVFIYNNNIDLNQSNVGLNEAKFDIAGQTNFFKNQVEIAFPGSIVEFEKNLKFLVAKNYVSDMLFGGLFSEVLASSYLITLPDWYINGIAAYIAYGWDDEMDDFVREFLKEEKVENITKLEGRRAMLAGQSIWNYVGEKYGRINISSILNLTRIIRNEEKSITNSLGIPFRQFLSNYELFYSNNALQNTEELPGKDLRIGKRLKDKNKYNMSLSPNGEWLAYSINKNGRFKLILESLKTGRSSTILKGGIKRSDNNEYLEAPIFDWGDSTTLGVIDYDRGINILRLYNPYTKGWQIQSMRKYEQINGMDIYPNGKTAVISISTKGQSDLYLISINKANSRRLTNDVFDDLFPRFIPDTKTIIFSSNRPTDTVTYSDDMTQLNKHLNLFTYTIGADEPITRITNDFGNNIQPIALDSSKFYYLSSKAGIFNLYQYDLEENISKQITAYPKGIKKYSLIENPNLFSFSMYKSGRLNLYLKE
ncbi:MAG: hypothetical protein R3321_06675, partial [Nitrososphaeraceae archaeon]|nr:hypothetical protein [Nitrososphaeraceae archaeon]